MDYKGKLKELCRDLLYIWLLIPGRCLPKKERNVLAKECMRVLTKEQSIPYYFGWFGGQENDKLMVSYEFPQVAIVMQGQVVYEKNFTMKTLCMYRKYYPNTKIILSTWKEEINKSLEEECSKYNIIIVTSKLPNDQGVFHLNCQIKSSIEGIKKAKELDGISFILKTRTDQRFYSPDFIKYFMDSLKCYPITGNSFLKNRIIYLGTSFLFIPFDLCDFMTFGRVEEMEKLYSIPYEKSSDNRFGEHDKEYRKILLDEMKIEHVSFSDFNTKYRERLYEKIKDISIPEIYITRKFIESYFPIDEIGKHNIYEIYWNFVKHNTVIVDDRELLFYWPKYDYRALQDTNLYMHKCGLDHIKWLELYVNNEN